MKRPFLLQHMEVLCIPFLWKIKIYDIQFTFWPFARYYSLDLGHLEA